MILILNTKSARFRNFDKALSRANEGQTFKNQLKTVEDIDKKVVPVKII
jgi:hypothetical protein